MTQICLCPIKIQNSLKNVKVNTWFKWNKLSLNINKNFYIVFHSSYRKYCDANMNIILDGKIVTKVELTKFLGVLIDQSLNFKKTHWWDCKKLSKIVGLFFKVRQLLPLEALLALYRFLFEPHFNYCNIICNNTYLTRTAKLLT